MLACFHAKGTGHVGFTASSCSSNKDVPVFCNVFTGCQTINQCFVQFSPRMIINCCNARIWLLKFSLADQPFQTIVFTVAVFDINKHTEPILERHFLHCRIIHLDAECIRHSSQTHFNKFIDCTLICHDCLPP